MKKSLFFSVMISGAVFAMEKPCPPRHIPLSLKPAHYLPCEKPKLQKFIVLSTAIQSLLERQLKSPSQETIRPCDRSSYRPSVV